MAKSKAAKKSQRSAKNFTDRVYDVVAKIPRGKVASYFEVARAAGSPGASRAVGTAMAKNEHFDRVPCHRVVRADGSIGKFSRTDVTKRELLEKEGVRFEGKKVSLKSFCYFT